MINFENQKLYNMETIRIQFQPNIKEKLIELLQTFSKDEIQIIEEDLLFEEQKKRINNSYQNLVNSDEKLYDIDELDAMLEKTISKYEG
jgi:hypothetical protein